MTMSNRMDRGKTKCITDFGESEVMEAMDVMEVDLRWDARTGRGGCEDCVGDVMISRLPASLHISLLVFYRSTYRHNLLQSESQCIMLTTLFSN